MEKGCYEAVYYTDGSKIEDSVAHAMVKNGLGMKKGKSVCTAEATAILNAVQIMNLENHFGIPGNEEADKFANEW